MAIKTLTEKSFTHLQGSDGKALYELLVNMVARLDRLETTANYVLQEAGASANVMDTVNPHNQADTTAWDAVEDLLNCYDTDTAIVLVNALKDAYTDHLTAGGTDAIHNANDATNTVSAADADDLATAITLANELKGDFNAHRSQAGVHFTNDSGNAVSAANATNEDTLVKLVNEILADFKGHVSASRAPNTANAINQVVLV